MIASGLSIGSLTGLTATHPVCFNHSLVRIYSGERDAGAPPFFFMDLLVQFGCSSQQEKNSAVLEKRIWVE